jgi:hypothetical protein
MTVIAETFIIIGVFLAFMMYLGRGLYAEID